MPTPLSDVASRLALCCSSQHTPSPEPYTLSLHDALPILGRGLGEPHEYAPGLDHDDRRDRGHAMLGRGRARSEEHTSELQSRVELVCRLLLEKKNPSERQRRTGPPHTSTEERTREPPHTA